MVLTLLKEKDNRMKNVHKIRSVTTLAFMLIGCLAFASCEWGKSREEQRKDMQLVVINVLDKQFYDDCHIKGSINVPMEQVIDYANSNLDKEKTQIVVYCANYKCKASTESARELAKEGFRQVWAYEGGVAEWKHLNHPTEGACSLEVSPYLTDYRKPEGYVAEADVQLIEAQELYEKMVEAGILK